MELLQQKLEAWLGKCGIVNRDDVILYAARLAKLGVNEPVDLAKEAEEVWTKDIKPLHIKKIKKGIKALLKREKRDALCTEVNGFIDRARLVIDESPKGCLGRGGNGEVFRGTLDGRAVAIKRLRQGQTHHEGDFAREAKNLRKLRHPNMLVYIGWNNSEEFLLVTELMLNGSLYHCIKRKPGTYAWAQLGAQVALDTSKALSYLHEQRIVHFDVKSHNILLSDDGRVAKLGDVGLLKKMVDTMTTAPAAFTPLYTAPEIKWGRKVNEKCDIYSLGMVMSVIYCQREPEFGEGRLDYTNAAVWFCELLDLMMHDDPSQRPCAQDVQRTIEAHLD